MYTQEINTDKELITDGIDNKADSSIGIIPDVTADFGALTCPLFGLKSMFLLRKLNAGQTAQIATESELSRSSLWRVAKMTNTRIIESRERNGRFLHLLRKS